MRWQKMVEIVIFMEFECDLKPLQNEEIRNNSHVFFLW